ncbi:MAG: ABC transporter permease [Chloroflexota bacterium]
MMVEPASPVKRPFFNRLLSGLKAVALPASVFIIIIVVVEVIVRQGLISPYIMAAPSKIVPRLFEDADYYALHFGVTLMEVAGGFALSVVVGIPLAAAMASWLRVRRSLLPVVVLTQVLPKMAVVPVILLIMGSRPQSKMVIGFIVAFFPIVINTYVGLVNVETAKMHLVKAMGATSFQIFRKVRLIAALPSMFAGFKLAATLCVVGALIGEIMGPYKGMGWIVKVGNYNHDMPLFWGAMVLLAIMGLGAFGAMQFLERITIPWHVSQRGRG